MNDQVLVETTNPHRNLHGDKQRKEVGDIYLAPKNVVIRLLATDLVRLADEPKPKASPRKRAAKKRG